MKRDLHAIKVITDDMGIVTDVLIDGERVKGCTGITARYVGAVDFLNVTLSMEAKSLEGLMLAVNVIDTPTAREMLEAVKREAEKDMWRGGSGVIDRA